MNLLLRLLHRNFDTTIAMKIQCVQQAWIQGGDRGTSPPPLNFQDLFPNYLSNESILKLKTKSLKTKMKFVIFGLQWPELAYCKSTSINGFDVM